ncbi:Insect cuticle protein [Popillia japonica]|uniref:Insect cuticle protein n=1 Tax=Popillia japonica TaxID=7064 RepID=A0AAW1HX66_POPJA
MKTLVVVICSVMVSVSNGQVANGGGDPIPTPVSSPGYETANGIKVEERGIRSNLQDSPIISSGTFEYTAPDNTAIAVKYVANENGFLPEGSHLPIPPPIPAQIIRALEWNAAHPEPNKR